MLPQLIAGCLAGLTAARGIVAESLGSLLDLMQHSQAGGGAARFGFVVIFGSAALGRAINQIGKHEE